MTDIIDELSWRGLLAVSTDLDELRQALGSGPVTVYAGFDPTAPGLHIGNLVILITLRRLQLAGHRPIGLVGGATGLIGDPSGKSAERVLNPREVVAQWAVRLRAEIERIIEFGPGQSGALLVSNLDWTQDLSALDFLRETGKHFSVNQMLARESVRARLDSGGITYTEFSYQILQALDYLELYRRHGCTLQAGGSDQWGNLVAGVDLIRRAAGVSVHALATPLITKPDGTKYGKTEGGAIWLSADLMSPYAFYQFWINRTDAEVATLLRVFTFRTRDEIAELERATVARPAAREAQRVLAQDVTTLVHGAAEATRAATTGRILFGGRASVAGQGSLAGQGSVPGQGEAAGQGSVPGQGEAAGQSDLGALDEATLIAALREVPAATAVRVPASAITTGDGSLTAHASVLPNAAAVSDESQIPPVSELMARVGIVPSRSAARRAIAEGGAYLNNRKVTDENEVPAAEDLLHGKFLVLRRGRRTIGVVEVLVTGPPVAAPST